MGSIQDDWASSGAPTAHEFLRRTHYTDAWLESRFLGRYRRGIVFMMMEMLLVQFYQPMSMWSPPRVIAAIAMGRDVLPPPDTFNLMVLMVAMIIHFVLSLIYAFILGWIVSRWHMHIGGASVAGLVFGLGIYVVNFYGFTAIFSWFADARGWIAILSRAMFGLVLGLVYEPIERRDAQHAIHQA